VREASNREAFLDRIFIATGFDVRVIDEAETNRFTYLAVHPLLAAEPALRESDTLVVEVGGGSTDLLVVRHGQVVQSQVYRLGSLRMRQEVEQDRIPLPRQRKVMESLIDRTLRQITGVLPARGSAQMLALGGDARFACAHCVTVREAHGLARLGVAKAAGLADEVLGMATDEVVRKYHLSYPDAETLGPALLTYVRLARMLDRKYFFVCDATLREGALLELATGGALTEEFAQQVVGSAAEIAARYGFDRRHAEQVAQIAGDLFDVLQGEHYLGRRYRLLLQVACTLHDIGMFVSNRSHHKHSMYLILNSDIFGLGGRDRLLTALTARYHRRALPSMLHPEYAALDRKSRAAVAKLAAILRVADALSRSHAAVRKFEIAVTADSLVIGAHTTGDLTLEQHALREKGEMFERVFGRKVILRSAEGKADDARA
jgi:exopolyphosphatase / guanosine-5'-triphosphate,3'-diphosphate pyrophosphatase